jgi:hypothetical protein
VSIQLLVKTFTRLTSTDANLSGNGFTHLRLMRRDPFEPPGLRADFRFEVGLFVIPPTLPRSPLPISEPRRTEYHQALWLELSRQ